MALPARCDEARRWIKAHLGRDCFAPFTGQDYAAFALFVHAVDLYARGDDDGQRGALAAMAGAMLGMQPKCHAVARKAIPFALDWHDELPVWHRAAELAARLELVPARVAS